MDKNMGYIKLHRQLLKNAYLSKEKPLKLWIHMLLTAAYKPYEIVIDGSNIKVPVGGLITSYRDLSTKKHIPTTTVYRILRKMTKESMIRINAINKKKILVILTNFETYQK